MGTTAGGEYSLVTRIACIDAETVEKMKTVFGGYRDRGVLIDCSFDDDWWRVNDRYKTDSLVFSQVSEDEYRENWEETLGFSYHTFILFLKAFIMSLIGRYAAGTLVDTIRDCAKMMRLDPDGIRDWEGAGIRTYAPWQVRDFLSMLPVTETVSDLLEELSDGLEKMFIGRPGNRRELLSFDTYMLFADIFKDFWSQELSTREKLFYFPLYVWWRVSACNPMRPKEIVLLPRGCCTERDGRYYMLIRKLRKGVHGPVAYNPAIDCDTMEIPVPKDVYDEVIWYETATEGMEPADNGTLFRVEAHRQFFGGGKIKNSRHYRTGTLYYVLNMFYSEIIDGRYGLKTDYSRSGEHLPAGKIGYILLGDTRHISMINLALEGADPVMAALLAGHESTDMASWYYNNLDSLVDSMTYRMARDVKNGKVVYHISQNRNSGQEDAEYVEMDGGRCFSEHVVQDGDYVTDCVHAIGPNGEIGYCRWCGKWRGKDRGGRVSDASPFRQKLHTDCAILGETIRKYRIHYAEKEDLAQVMQRVMEDVRIYQRFLRETQGPATDG